MRCIYPRGISLHLLISCNEFQYLVSKRCAQNVSCALFSKVRAIFSLRRGAIAEGYVQYSVHDTAAPLRLAFGSMKASSSFAARSRFLPGVFDPHHGPMTMMLTLACFEWLYAHAHSEAQSRNHTHTFSTACIHPSCSSHIACRSSQHKQRLGFVQTK